MKNSVLFLLFFASFQMLNAQNECKDELILKGFKTIQNVTVIKINKKDIVYKDCKANSTVTLSKMDLLGIEYPNGSKDKFDFTGNNVKKIWIW